MKSKGWHLQGESPKPGKRFDRRAGHRTTEFSYIDTLDLLPTDSHCSGAVSVAEPYLFLLLQCDDLRTAPARFPMSGLSRILIGRDNRTSGPRSETGGQV